MLIQSCCIFFLTWRACRIRLQYAPYILELDEATRYVWCQCGVSMKQPFCDSTSHRSSPLLPPDAMRALHAAVDLQQPCGAKNCMCATPPAPTPEFIRVRRGFDVDICVAWWGYTDIDVKCGRRGAPWGGLTTCQHSTVNRLSTFNG